MSKVTEALQKRDIVELQRAMEEGFKGTHDRQDKTNGKVLKAADDIVELKNWKSFMTGGMTILAMMVVPIFIYFMTHLK